MSRFIESICCEDGSPKLLSLHQARLDRTFAKFFPLDSVLDLVKIITNIPFDGKHKCRLEYDARSYAIDYQPYQAKVINSIQIIHDNNLDYEYKSTNRSSLDLLYQKRKEADDIIIIRNGFVTDSYYANLAFFDGNDWWTPRNPLLKGVKREFLLANHQIKTKEIYERDLSSFSKVSIINAMLDIGEMEIPVKKLVL
jgi:4-amino-4-deoxychorismate lyase